MIGKVTIVQPTGLTTTDQSVTVADDVVEVSKKRLQNMEWELRAWREAFEHLTYDKVAYRIVEPRNGKEVTKAQERVNRG